MSVICTMAGAFKNAFCQNLRYENEDDVLSLYIRSEGPCIQVCLHLFRHECDKLRVVLTVAEINKAIKKGSRVSDCSPKCLNETALSRTRPPEKVLSARIEPKMSQRNNLTPDKAVKRMSRVPIEPKMSQRNGLIPDKAVKRKP